MTFLELVRAGVVYCREMELPELAADAPLPEWLHLVPFGTWRGHSSGPFQVTSVHAAQIVANFPRPRDLVIDYEHQSHQTEVNGQPAPAAGWIDQLELRADGVWGHVRSWTSKAAGHLRAREYRYLSPTIAWKKANKVTGESQGATLLSVALTNVPFFDVLAPVLARAANPPGRLMDKELLKLLGLPEDATEEQVRAAVLDHQQRGLAACRVFGLKATATAAEIEGAHALLKARASLGDTALRELKLDVTKPPTAEAEQRLCAELRHTGYVSMAAHLDALTATGAREEARSDDEVIAAGRATGKITPATEQHVRSLLASDRPGVIAWLGAAPAIVPVRGPTAPRRTASPTLDPIAATLCRDLGLTPEEFERAERAKEARQ